MWNLFILIVEFIALSIVIYVLVKQRSKYQKLEETLLYDSFSGMANENYIIEKFVNRDKTYIVLNPKGKQELMRVNGQKTVDLYLYAIAQKIDILRDFNGCKIYKYKNLGFVLEIKGKLNDIEIREAITAIENALKEEVVILGNKNKIKFFVTIFYCDKRYTVYEVVSRIEAGFDLNRFKNEDKEYTLLDKEEYESYESLMKYEKELFSLDIDVAMLPFYQFKYDIKSNRVIGVEALARVKHPRLGIIKPDSFIKYFEEIKQIDRIDLAIFNKACMDFSEWKRRDIVDQNFRISVNFSIYTIECVDIEAEFKRVVNEFGLRYNLIDLEITETLKAKNLNIVSEKLHRLSKLGVIISLDDFFSGHSNFEKISMLPINNLKLDKAFLEENFNKKNTDLIKSIKKFTEHNNLNLIVEGVETQRQLDFLRDIGVSFVQGYYYSKPLSKESLENELKLKK